MPKELNKLTPEWNLRKSASTHNEIYNKRCLDEIFKDENMHKIRENRPLVESLLGDKLRVTNSKRGHTTKAVIGGPVNTAPIEKKEVSTEDKIEPMDED